MTAAILPPGAQPFLTLPPTISMPEAGDDLWRLPHYQSLSLPVGHYSADNHSPTLGGVHESGLSKFYAESGEYEGAFHSPMISAPMWYIPNANFGSDLDVGTPSTAGFPSDVADGYFSLRHTSASDHHHHHLSVKHDRMSSAAQSPQSSLESFSPHQPYASLSEVAIKEEKPTFTRSITAPTAGELRSRKSMMPANGIPSMKRSGSDDEDDDFVPSEECKQRGRKRQRIPHTAVERRYRENLNAHLDKLRQAVPSLAPKCPTGSAKPGEVVNEGARPSKCEVLSGAIEHITALGKENSALKTEVQALKSRLEDLERWCNASTKSGFH